MDSAQFVVLNSGYKMPIFGLGTALTSYDETRNAVKVALECGYRSLDTAYLYLNEESIGDALQDWLTKGKLKREDIFVCSKLPPIANRAEDVNRFLTMSLKNLKLDYLDLYLIHHPFGLKYINDKNLRSIENYDKLDATLLEIFRPDEPSLLDDDTDLISVWKGLEKEVKAGRVRSIGVSNFNSEQISRINKSAEIPIAVNQVELHPYFQQRRLVEFCRSLGITVVAYGPLASPYTHQGKDMNLLMDPNILEISKKYGKSASQVVLKSLVQRQLVVIPKSCNPGRIKSNFDIFDFTLSEEDMNTIAKIDKGAKGRIFDFKIGFKGCEKHKEYPFHIEF